MRARIQRQQKLIKNTKVASMLYDEIQTNNEQLKFEYVEIVKNGLEDEHLLDLLKEPQPIEETKKERRRHLNNNSERVRAFKDLNRLIHKQALPVLKTSQAAKNNIETKAVALSAELRNKIHNDLNKISRFLEESREKKSSNVVDASAVESLKYATKEERGRHLKQLAIEREEKMRKAKERRSERDGILRTSEELSFLSRKFSSPTK